MNWFKSFWIFGREPFFRGREPCMFPSNRTPSLLITFHPPLHLLSFPFDQQCIWTKLPITTWQILFLLKKTIFPVMTNDYLSPWVLLCRHINHWTKVLADTLGLSSFEVVLYRRWVSRFRDTNLQQHLYCCCRPSLLSQTEIRLRRRSCEWTSWQKLN